MCVCVRVCACVHCWIRVCFAKCLNSKLSCTHFVSLCDLYRTNLSITVIADSEFEDALPTAAAEEPSVGCSPGKVIFLTDTFILSVCSVIRLKIQTST